MNFNLKYSIFSTAAIIFILGSAAVADTQLRGGGGGRDTRGLSDGDNVNYEVYSSSEVESPNSGGESEQLDLLSVDERKLDIDWSDSNESDNGANISRGGDNESNLFAANDSRDGDNNVVSWESDNKVVNWESYESNPAKNGWGNNCPVPRQSTVGTSCRSFVPNLDNRAEAIFQCRYPNAFSNGDVLYFQCTNTKGNNPQWTARRRRN